MLRVGIFGGGFNPPHKAHLFVVTDALSSGRFDEIWVLPCWEHAFNKGASLVPFNERTEMCRLAFSQWPNVIVRAYEKMYRTRYTIHLITNLQKDYPDNKFTFIVGSDNMASKYKWKHWDVLETLVDFFITPRQGTIDSLWVMPDISSTRIRELIAAHKTNVPYVQKMLPEAVYNHITEKRLYQ